MATHPDEDIKIFAAQCVFVRSIYLHRKTLFDLSTTEQKEIMSRTARYFFGDLSQMSIEYMILQVCKITDQAKSGGKENLTTEFLLTHYDFTLEPEKAQELKELNEKMRVFREKLRPARNKLISHSDRASIHDGHALGGVPDKEWDEFWFNLQDFVCIIYQKVFGDTMWINSVAGASDADSLLKALKQSACFEQMRSCLRD
jgi:hypothetical protein